MSIDRSPKGSGGKFVCAISFVRLRMRAGVMQLRLQETRQMSSLLMKPTERTGEMMMFVTETRGSTGGPSPLYREWVALVTGARFPS